MNAALQPLEAWFEPMTFSWLPEVLQVEQSAYPQPWSEVNFLDSLQAGYQAQMLMAGSAENPELLGYFVAMKGVDEVHLLNITVAPAHQRQGWSRVMLDGLGIWARGQGAQWLWLEVRLGNARARHLRSPWLSPGRHAPALLPAQPGQSPGRGRHRHEPGPVSLFMKSDPR